MAHKDYLRQLGILNPKNIIFPITIIGCGGIGSIVSLEVAELGFDNIALLDKDKIEAHNLPSQLFFKKDMGNLKVDAAANVIDAFADCKVIKIPEFFDGSQPLSGIVVSGVHDMDNGRIPIWQKIKFNEDVPLYIDGRIGKEVIEVFTIQPSQIDDIEFYEQHLFPNSDMAELPCTERAVIYVGFFIAAFIGSQLKKWINGEQYYRRINYDLKTMSHIYQK